MPGLMIMLPLAVGIALCFLVFFLWSVRNGDYEDTEMQKYRMLYDDADDTDRLMVEPGRDRGGHS
jgi:cbb3-type cytochrome oxidase maturation protein